MKTFTAHTVIRSSAETIWAILTDARGYAGWNPEVHRIDGSIAAGAEVTLHRHAEPRISTVRVSLFEPPHRLAFTGSGGMPEAVLKAVRTYELVPNRDGATELTQTLVFSGLMAGLVTRAVPDQTPILTKIGEALKTRAEIT